MLEIENLYAGVEDKVILQGVTLKIASGETHAIMGPNGAGKSTLAKVLAGDPSCTIFEGKILFCGEDVTALEPEERVHKGIFMSFQYPIEIPGVSNREFLQVAYNAKRKAQNLPPCPEDDFNALLEEKMNRMCIPTAFSDRSVNSGFSGGEKKRNEILQMAVLDPLFAILDETDSGLDIDAMRIVADGVNGFKSKEKGILLITHYQRLLNYIQPDVVHIMMNGKIQMTGDAHLPEILEEKGYSWVSQGDGDA